MSMQSRSCSKMRYLQLPGCAGSYARVLVYIERERRRRSEIAALAVQLYDGPVQPDRGVASRKTQNATGPHQHLLRDLLRRHEVHLFCRLSHDDSHVPAPCPGLNGRKYLLPDANEIPAGPHYHTDTAGAGGSFNAGTLPPSPSSDRPFSSPAASGAQRPAAARERGQAAPAPLGCKGQSRAPTLARNQRGRGGPPRPTRRIRC